jgi:hypothetical protein
VIDQSWQSPRPRLRWINVARPGGQVKRLVVGWSGMRGAVSLPPPLALPQDFLKHNPIPDGPRRAVLGVQVPLEGADERVAAESGS